MNRPLKAALVALLGLSASLGTSHAQATASYSAGDLLLGFRASDGTGATKNYVVNLGSADNLSTLSTPKLFGADGAIATDLTNVFGADWNTRSDPSRRSEAFQPKRCLQLSQNPHPEPTRRTCGPAVVAQPKGL